ncbi:MAG: carboxymuconolactone decarboxylase family protein [Acidobacteria bacterium]|nr:carboxymuconolactone decarboxylase family protein [Acidobacteriota bacterium]
MATAEANLETDGQDLFAELRRLSPKVTGGLVRMRSETYRDGAVEAKYKLLTALVVSVAIRCEPCIRGYVRMAVEAGATEPELLEFLNVAITMQGCPGEEWALKAFRAYREILRGDETRAQSCCH